MIIIFSIIISAILFRQRGSGMMKALWLGIMVTWAYAAHGAEAAAAWAWLFVVMGCFPTQTLFTAIHGQPPARKDHWAFRGIQDAALRFKGKAAGVAYGCLRGLVASPAFIALGEPAMVILLYHGAAYYLWGLYDRRTAVRNAEFAIGGIIGFFLA